jgi:2-hydroxy-6-oxonona-2,4-dienedioate hydrolase
MNDSTSSPLQLAVHTVGSGPPFVLFHGGMGSRNHWVRNIDALAAHFTVHAFDLPGYGDSPTVPKDTPQQDYVTMVMASLRTVVGDEPFDIAGFSFGSIIAAMSTVRLGGQVRRLTMLGAGGFGPSAVLDMRPIPPESAGEAARRAVFRHNLGQLMIARPENLTEEAVDLQAANFRSTRFDGRHFSVTPNTPASLERMACPVQVVFGSEDALWKGTLDQHLATVRRVRPEAKIVLLPGAGHWVMFEEPEAVNRLLLEFHRA